MWEENLIHELNFWRGRLKTTSYQKFKKDHLSLFEKWFKIPIKIFSRASVLDIGSGPASYLYDIKARIKIAVDPLMDEYEKITKDYKFPSDDVIKLKGKGEELPFTSKLFDFVFAFNGIDHWEDWQKGILEIKRVLKKKGQLLLYVVFDRPNDTPHHPHNIDEKSVNWIKKQGFKIIKEKIYTNENRRRYFGILEKL